MDEIKRAKARSEHKTMKMLNELLTDYLNLRQTWGEVERIEHREKSMGVAARGDSALAATRVELERSKLKADLAEVQLREEKLKLERELLRSKDVAVDPMPMDHKASLHQKWFAGIEDLSILKELVAELVRKYPDQQKEILKAFEHARMAILQGRR
jgi:hypothetical protein